MEEIKIENLSFTYPARNEPSLKNISLNIKPGEFVTICGKSGCGKTTLLRMLKPEISPHGEKSGTIYFEGNSLSELTQRESAEKIGFVYQDPDNQIVCDKVWHELAFSLESIGLSSTEIRGRTAEMAAFFGIQNQFDKNTSELSGGQKQLLNLASVMAMQPKILILDEPTSQLDPIAAHDFLQTLSRINKELGTTVILSEHRLEEALPLSDRVIAMENGQIISDGDAREVGREMSKTDLRLSLPTPMRVYYSIENDFECPITVREGRDWLLKMPINSEIKFEKNQKASDDKLILSAEGLWFRYEKNGADILKGLSLKLHENELYALIGSNGAGKTTLASVIGGINKPYRGKIRIAEGKKIAVLPQNPQSLFVKKTVAADLYEVADKGMDEEVQNVVKFCGLSDLLDSHPYDLSGGEQQRAALAKVLLTKPDILILDEPTKGLDAYFKEKLVKMLRGLLLDGISIIMVSHDIEFCAKYADNIGLVFDGIIVCEDEPRKFFAEKSFYTTAASRMSRGLIPDAILDEDIIASLGGEYEKSVENQPALYKQAIEKKPEPKKKRTLSAKDIILGTVFAILFLILQFGVCPKLENTNQLIAEVAAMLLAGISLVNLIPTREFSGEVQIPADKRKLKKRTLAESMIILLLIPLTIFFGMYYLGDRKYYFISLMIILEAMCPFFIIFEGQKPQARELVIISVLCAIGVVGRAAFMILPQFKPVTAIVIIAGISMGAETGFLVGAITGFVSNFFFGQGPWTPWQMFAFGLIGFLAGLLFRKGILRKTRIDLCVFGFLATVVLYGGILNSSSVLMSQAQPNTAMFLSSFIVGLPFDLIHALSTAFFLWFAAKPMCDKLDRIKLKYGL